MQKKTPDYDNVFKTMKSKHKRLTFTFPDGQAVNYESANVILEEFSKDLLIRLLHILQMGIKMKKGW